MDDGGYQAPGKDSDALPAKSDATPRCFEISLYLYLRYASMPVPKVWRCILCVVWVGSRRMMANRHGSVDRK